VSGRSGDDPWRRKFDVEIIDSGIGGARRARGPGEVPSERQR
jgi:hypothetical protein